MDLVQEFLIFFYISLLSFAVDKNKCGKGNLILFLHHFVNIFANFGWLATNKLLLQIYIFVPVIVVAHWLMNGNKCVLTQVYNNICDTPDQKFNDIFDEMGLKKHDWWKNYGHIVFLIFGYSIALNKLDYFPFK